MPMPPYPIYCQGVSCKNEAAYKIASQWSDGVVSELKTYALCCEACLGQLFRSARLRRAACRLIPGETLEEPGIYRLQRGAHDRQLERLFDLEERLADASASS